MTGALRVAIDGFRGLSGTMELRPGVNLVVAPNGHRKTALLAGVGSALCRDLATPYGHLPVRPDGRSNALSPDATEAYVTVMDSDSKSGVGIAWSSEKKTAVPKERGKGLPVPDRLAAWLDDPMEPGTLTEHVLRIADATPTEEQWIDAVTAAGAGEPDRLAGDIMRRGAEVVSHEYGQARLRAVRAWELASGERWGSKKVISWRPEGWGDFDGWQVNALSGQIQGFEEALIAAQRQAGVSEAERQQMEGLASGQDKLRATMQRRQMARDTTQAGADAAARTLVPEGAWTSTCPECGHTYSCGPNPEAGEAARAASKALTDLLEAERELRHAEAAAEKLAGLDETDDPGHDVDRLALQLKLAKTMLAANLARYQAESMDEIEKATGPTGLRLDLLKGAQAKINAALAAASKAVFTDGTILSLAIQERRGKPEVVPILDIPGSFNGDARNMTHKTDRASSIERRCRIILAAAAHTAHPGVAMLVDNLDLFDDGAKTAVAGYLSTLDVPVLVAMTHDNPEKIAGQMSGVPVWTITKDGEVQRV